MRISYPTGGLPSIQRGKPIEVIINGRKVQAFEGELVSTILTSEGITVFGRKAETGRPCGVYCGMGVCYECLVTIDGTANLRACQTPAAGGMVIDTGPEVTSC